MFIVEQRPWLGIWLTIYFSGIRGEATKRIGGTMSWLCNQWIGLLISPHQANWLVGWRWLRRSAGCATTLTRDRGGDTRTHILHFKENANSFLPFLFAHPRRIKTRVFELVCVMRVNKTIYYVVFDRTLCWQYKSTAGLICSCMIPVNKNGKRDWFVFGEVKSFSHKKSSTLSTILAIYVQGHSVCARSLGPLTIWMLLLESKIHVIYNFLKLD